MWMFFPYIHNLYSYHVLPSYTSWALSSLIPYTWAFLANNYFVNLQKVGVSLEQRLWPTTSSPLPLYSKERNFLRWSMKLNQSIFHPWTSKRRRSFGCRMSFLAPPFQPSFASWWNSTGPFGCLSLKVWTKGIMFLSKCSWVCRKMHSFFTKLTSRWMT